MDASTSGDDRLWGALAYVLSFCLPVAAPLLIFLVKRRSRFVAFHALQAMFVPLGLALLALVTMIVGGILGLLGPLALLNVPLGFAAWAIGAGAVLCKILAAINASCGRWYRIPFVWSYAERLA